MAAKRLEKAAREMGGTFTNSLAVSGDGQGGLIQSDNLEEVDPRLRMADQHATAVWRRQHRQGWHRRATGSWIG